MISSDTINFTKMFSADLDIPKMAIIMVCTVVHTTCVAVGDCGGLAIKSLTSGHALQDSD